MDLGRTSAALKAFMLTDVGNLINKMFLLEPL
jgi:hypothetical protein